MLINICKYTHKHVYMCKCSLYPKFQLIPLISVIFRVHCIDKDIWLLNIKMREYDIKSNKILKD